MLRKISLLICLFVGNAFAIDDAAVSTQWGYKGNVGPARWGQLNSDFIACSTGKSQSPINIPKKVPHASGQLAFNYSSSKLDIVDDGQTDLTIGDKQELILDGRGVQVNFPSQDSKESITLNGKNYRLIQFHFHSPSENTWHGRSFPLEIHFVHQGENGKVAVVGVFVIGGPENMAIQKLAKHIPKVEGKEYTIEGEQINPADLLPATHQYYSFTGSLTTPPCTEGLSWMVLETPITASPAQIAVIRKAAGGANARPVQQLNGRKINYIR